MKSLFFLSQGMSVKIIMVPSDLVQVACKILSPFGTGFLKHINAE